MKKKIIIIAAAIVVLVGILFGAEAYRQRKIDENSTDVTVYYLNDQGTEIVFQTEKIQETDTELLPELAVEELLRLSAAEAVLNGIEITDEFAVADFSKEFLTGDMSEDLLSAYSVVKTLCQLNNISAVKVTVDGKDIQRPDGNFVGYLRSTDIILSDDEDVTETRNITLYFRKANEKNLAREVRSIKITDTKPVEQYVVTELIKGPNSETNSAVLNGDTALLSAETNEGTCYVNMKQNFVDKNSSSDEGANLAIYSIVNSLSHIEGVECVQFLVEGKVVENFGSIMIDKPFTKRMDLVAN